MNILLALDGSARAMDEAVRLAATREGARLTALFVLDTGWSVYTGSDFLLGSHARGTFLDYARDDEFAQERAALAELERRAVEAGVTAEVKTIQAGRVVDALLDELKTGGYDRLVMAVPFRRGLEVMRDAPQAILKAAECDVTFVRREPSLIPPGG